MSALVNKLDNLTARQKEGLLVGSSIGLVAFIAARRFIASDVDDDSGPATSLNEFIKRAMKKGEKYARSGESAKPTDVIFPNIWTLLGVNQ